MYSVHYINRSGSHATKKFNNMVDVHKELDRLSNRRIEAKALHSDGELIGQVWKNEGRWTWTCDPIEDN